MKIVDYSKSHADQLDGLNSRLRDGGSDLVFSPYLPPADGLPVERRSYVAVDESGVARGAYSVIRQQFLLNGSTETVGFLQLPLSEGIVNPRFGVVGVLLIRDFAERNRFCFGLGMGGLDRPLPLVLSKMRFRVSEVPFFFFVCRPSSFLKNLAYLNKRPVLRAFSSVVGATRLASPPINLLHRFRGRSRASLRSVQVEEQPSFGSWNDEVWRLTREQHSLIAVRDESVMRSLYRPDDRRLHRLVVRHGASVAGWALVGDTQLDDHNYFGEMRLGSIIDCLAVSGRRAEVARAATDYLRDRGVDLIVSNQQDVGWREALLRTGYLNGPSNFVFAASPELAKTVNETDPGFERIHMNRGDGDGPYNL